ncbi:hypothetical protein C8R47DRAFT_1313570 [Mycena vitilis]|nr:hypothetical protein C8R47DRAFT_1313570 [Mycena vitilis]
MVSYRAAAAFSTSSLALAHLTSTLTAIVAVADLAIISIYVVALVRKKCVSYFSPPASVPPHPDFCVINPSPAIPTLESNHPSRSDFRWQHILMLVILVLADLIAPLFAGHAWGMYQAQLQTQAQAQGQGPLEAGLLRSPPPEMTSR